MNRTLDAGLCLAERLPGMIKLTRLNRRIVVVNPDHIYAVAAWPDTTLRLVGCEMILVRESVDELIAKVREYRQSVMAGALGGVTAADGIAGVMAGDRQRYDAGAEERRLHERTTTPVPPRRGGSQ